MATNADFMDIIQDYPTIYNRSSRDFKDKTKKANCWAAVAERVNEPVEVVKKRYETIRTQFSKYLKNRRGASGAGAADITPVDSRYERLMWLKNFIVSRPNSGNFQRKHKPAVTPSRNFDLEDDDVDDDGDDGDDAFSSSSNDGDDNGMEKELCEKDDVNEPKIKDKNCKEFQEVNSPGLPSDEFDCLEDINISKSKPSRATSSTPPTSIESKDDRQPSKKKAKTEDQQQKKSKKHAKKESRKRELEKTDIQLNQALACLNSSITKPEEKGHLSDLRQMDEDHLYALSLANRLQKLDNRNKALVRNGIEKIFLEIELGHYNFNAQQQTGFHQLQNTNLHMWQSHMLNSQNTPTPPYTQFLNNE